MSGWRVWEIPRVRSVADDECYGRLATRRVRWRSVVGSPDVASSVSKGRPPTPGLLLEDLELYGSKRRGDQPTSLRSRSRLAIDSRRPTPIDRGTRSCGVGTVGLDCRGLRAVA